MASIEGMSLSEFFKQKRIPKIVTIWGSQRDGSWNKMLHDHSVEVIKKNGGDVESIDIGALNLPLYNPNDEDSAFPENAKILKAKLVAADGIFIASPEYNGFTSPLLLNAITWATRGEGDMYAGFKGKVICLMATSPGALGGMRMIRSLTTMLQDMGATVIPGSNSIGNAFKVFAKDGTIQDDRTKGKIESSCSNLVHYCRYQANREQDCAMAMQFMNMGEYGSVDLPN